MRRVAPVLVALTTAACAAAPAGAATLATDHQCYRSSQLITATVSGFPAGPVVSFRGNGASLRLNYPDEQAGGLSGDGTVHVQAPPIEDGTDVPPTGIAFSLTAESWLPQDNAENLRTAASADLRLIDAFTAYRTPRTPAPRAKVTYAIRGAVELTPAYLHITRQALTGRNRVLGRRTIKLGTPAPPCGTLNARAYATGSPTPKPGIYSSQVDLSPTIDQTSDSTTRAGALAVIVRPRR